MLLQRHRVLVRGQHVEQGEAALEHLDRRGLARGFDCRRLAFPACERILASRKRCLRSRRARSRDRHERVCGRRARLSAPRLPAWPGRGPDVVAGGQQAGRDGAGGRARPGVQRKVARFSAIMRSSLRRRGKMPARGLRAPARSVACAVASRPRSTQAAAPLTTKANRPRGAAERAAGRRRTAPAHRRSACSAIIGCGQARAVRCAGRR